MKSKFIYRDYQKGDEIHILDLFEKVFGRKISFDYWKWRFVDNPFGRGIIKLLFDEDLLIGHYAVIPMHVQVKNNLIRAVFSMTTMTHPEYQKQGIFTYLAEEAYKEAKSRGFKFVYGFPNKNSYYGIVKKLNWTDFGQLTVLYKDLKENTSSFLQKVNNISEIKEFNESVDSLWEQIKQNYSVIVPRTKEFLNWRFVHNPEVNYKIYSIHNHKKWLWYIVLKIYRGEKETIGHIVDIISINDSIAEELLKVSYNYFLENGIQKISCWMQDVYFYSGVMKKHGFIRKIPDFETYFGIRIFDKKIILKKEVENFSNWYLTMGDSDVF